MGLFSDSNRDIKEAQRREAEQARERIAREQEERRRREEEAVNAARRREEEAKAAEAARKAEIAQKRTSFLDTTKNYATDKLKAQGITDDKYGIGNYFNTLLNQRVSGIGDDVDISGIVSPEELYNTAYNDVRTGVRRNATSKFNESIGDDYATRTFADTADDAILDSILNTQYGSANEAIERARSRGMLNDAGYAAATKGLGETKVAANTKLQDTGAGVLERYRTGLGSEAERIRNKAANLDLIDNFDIAGSIKGLQDKATGYGSRLEGDVRTAVGDTDFFDVGSLLGKAGSQQGFVNPGGTGNPVLAAFAPKSDPSAEKDPNKRRLLGSTGAF